MSRNDGGPFVNALSLHHSDHFHLGSRRYLRYCPLEQTQATKASLLFLTQGDSPEMDPSGCDATRRFITHNLRVTVHFQFRSLIFIDLCIHFSKLTTLFFVLAISISLLGYSLSNILLLSDDGNLVAGCLVMAKRKPRVRCSYQRLLTGKCSTGT